MPGDDIDRLFAAHPTRRTVLAAGLAGLAATAFGGVPVGSRRRLPRPAGGVTLPGPAFTLGVASGDPRPDSVILWTRLAPLPLEGGGMPDQAVALKWDVASDDGFEKVVREGTATATPDAAHSVHVDAKGLRPATDYFYRFRVGDDVSPVGRTRTLPKPGSSPKQLRLALATCQDYGTGYYTAYRDLVAEDPALVLFLGDYIYEHPIFSFADRGNPPIEAVTLDDYRARYALYKTDPDLQSAHQAAPWVTTWDDHEVDNNYAGDVSQAGDPPEQFHERRAAAYRAWYEHMPVRLKPPRNADVRVYQDLAFGDLARFFVLDTRQYADVPPCRETSAPLADAGPTCSDRERPDRTILGDDQERWLVKGIDRADERWSVLAKGVQMGGLNIDLVGGPAQYYLDSWDGYPAARTRVLDALAGSGAKSPIVLTGDYHASFVSDLRPDPFDTSTPVLGTEFVGPAISSSPFSTDFTATNPHVRYFDDQRGYAMCTVDRGTWTTEFRYVTDVQDPAGTVVAGPTFVVERGTPEAQPA